MSRDPTAVFSLRPPVEFPDGVSETELRTFLESVRVADGSPRDLLEYSRQDFWRFVRTLSLVRGLRGRCLELGANPYFTTMLLREFTDLELSLGNYFGEPAGTTIDQAVLHRQFDSGEEVESRLVSHLFNLEKDRFPFRDGEFDLVLFCEILEHLVDDPLAALREIKRVLRPGGALVLTTPNATRLESVARMVAGANIYDPYSAHGPYGRHNREYNRQELYLLLTYVGFDVEHLETADVYANGAGDYTRLRPLARLLRNRSRDLGQYLFARAVNRRRDLGKRPDFLFRSYPLAETEPFPADSAIVTAGGPRKPIIDVDLLVESLKERVAREREAGAYADDLSGIELEVVPPQGRTSGVVDGFDLGGTGPRVRFRPELGFSSKPVIGPVITMVKRFQLRLLFHVFDDLARQTDAAIARVEAALAAEMGARERLELQMRAETAAREAIQTDVKALSERLGDLADRLEHLKLEPRLARLERRQRSVAPTPPPVEGSPRAAPPPAQPGMDYMVFEERFRPSDSVRERQAQYVELLRGSKRVADLGCGRGELVGLLNEAGVSAYGVEIEPDFVDLMREQGLEVVAADAIEHLRGLGQGAVDGIVVSHVVEHLPAAAVSELVTLAAERLAEGGTLIMETPNPESLVAGSINFHRDLTHRRPIHPDTLAFLCENAGFPEVEIRRLSPVPENERLPVPGDGRLDDVVERLNELIYGYQDYAVVARH